MNKIIWSDLAYLTFSDIANYLTDNYSLDAALKFNEKTDSIIQNLHSFEEFCPSYSRRPVYRKCVINRYSSMLYRIDGNDIIIVSFFDNRSIHPF